MSLSNLTGPLFGPPDPSASNGELEVRLPPPRFTGPRVHHRGTRGYTEFIRADPLSEGPRSSALRLIGRPGRSTRIL
jgi:hypothetical protein